MPLPPKPMSSYWLLPAAADEAMFLEEIRQLAGNHGTPRFHPHLTLLGDLERDPCALSAETRTIATAAPAFSAVIADIVTGPDFFRSFFARFEIVPALAKLRAQASSVLATAPGLFMPHVSLLYGPVEEKAKAESAAEVRARFKDRLIHFDRLAVTNSANDVPITDWTMIDIVPLSG